MLSASDSSLVHTEDCGVAVEVAEKVVERLFIEAVGGIEIHVASGQATVVLEDVVLVQHIEVEPLARVNGIVCMLELEIPTVALGVGFVRRPPLKNVVARAGAIFMALPRASMALSRVMFRPLWGRNSWLARVLRTGQGARTGKQSV